MKIISTQLNVRLNKVRNWFLQHRKTESTLQNIKISVKFFFK